MPHDKDVEELAPKAGKLGWKSLALIVAFQAVAALIATFPAVLTFRTALPDAFDSLQHLWVMKWYKTCLLEGRVVFHCPDIQYPAGAPLGNFSALHFQALLYFPLSLFLSNDILCYNIIWFLGLVLTGVGTSLLVWRVVGDRACAAFGGLLAMLSAPMMAHANGHLELIYVGWFPVFLLAWMSFIDRPSKRRMVAAALGYVLVAMSAAYFMIFAIFPAALYVAWSVAKAGRAEARGWIKERLRWFFGFVATSLPCLLVLFSSQFWILFHGHSLDRPREEFDLYGSPLWSYLTPTSLHLLGSLLPSDPYQALGASAGERTSYLGAVTILLLAYAAFQRAGLRRASYLWMTFGLLVVLSLGSSWKVGGRSISLPSAWLWDYFPVYRMTRVPSRFNLFAGVLAGVLAAAGLRHLLARVPGQKGRAAVFAALTVLAVADMAKVPFWKVSPPKMPDCYAFLKKRAPKATILEIPHMGSGGSALNAACTYWQSLHRLTTSSGYSGHVNVDQDNQIGHNSPFQAERLAQEDYLEDASSVDFNIHTDLDFKDFLWLYLTVNDYDYVVLHQWEGSMPEHPVRLDRLKAILASCKIYEDSAAIVYDRSKLAPPAHPVQINVGEWRAQGFWQDRANSMIPKVGRLAVYNPDANKDLRLSLDAAAIRRRRGVALRSGERVLARWEVELFEYQSFVSPPFRLPAGLQELTLESEILEPEAKRTGHKKDRPYPLRVARVSLQPAVEVDRAIVREDSTRPSGATKTR